MLLRLTSEVYGTHCWRGDAAVEVPQQRPRVAAAEATCQLRCQERRQRCCCALVAGPAKVAGQPPKSTRRQHRMVVLRCLLYRKNGNVTCVVGTPRRLTASVLALKLEPPALG